MKIALISDIHGNYTTLNAVLQDMRKQKVDKIISLGDVATIGPQPREVIKALQDLNCICIRGNHEIALLNIEDAPQYQIAPPLISTLYWCREKLDSTDFSYIESFKNIYKFVLEGNANLLCFHASPQSTTDIILTTTPTSECERMLGNSDMTFMAGGHTHIQMQRRINGKLLINPGSVGSAFTRFFQVGEIPTFKPWAEYVILIFDNGNFHADMRQVSFDTAVLKQIISDSDIPIKSWWLDQYNSG